MHPAETRACTLTRHGNTHSSTHDAHTRLAGCRLKADVKAGEAEKGRLVHQLEQLRSHSEGLERSLRAAGTEGELMQQLRADNEDLQQKHDEMAKVGRLRNCCGAATWSLPLAWLVRG